MKYLSRIFILFSLYITALFPMKVNSQLPCEYLTLVSVERSFESPKICEQPGCPLDARLMEMAVQHAPSRVKEIVKTLKSGELF